jgi:hypothetical protein
MKQWNTASMALNVDWSSFDPKVCLVHDWDDGHIPETFRTGDTLGPNAGHASYLDDIENEEGSDEAISCNKTDRVSCARSNSTARTLLVWRPNTWHSSLVKAAVQVVDDALPASLVHEIYRFTINQNESSWGTYVPVNDILSKLWSSDDRSDPKGGSIDTLAAQACCGYLSHALRKSGGLLRELLIRELYEAEPHEFDQDDERMILSALTRSLHGVGVWALSSTAKSSVTYHVDYAEQVRYCHNVVVLPHLAGTLHCSPVERMYGGDLHVYESFQHYERHGYKACKEDLPEASNDSSLLHSILYRFNRLVVMAGHLPHSSAEVREIYPPDCRRVIVGFNLFGHDIGSIVQNAPEHSTTWKRQVKMMRLQQSQEHRRIPLSISSIPQLSPGIRKLFVLAKRCKIKDEWRREFLSNQLHEALNASRDSTTVPLTEMELVQRILSRCTSSSTTTPSWPTERDVQLFLREHWLP